MSLSVVNTDTARSILNGRAREGNNHLVSICGKVTCVSEVVRIKDNHIFMVKFIPGVDVIIKRKECLPWQQELTPRKEYIFTNLRPTTLQKGGRTPQRVFTVTRDSKLLSPESADMRFMTEPEILKQYGPQHAVEETPSVNRHGTLIDGLFSYQGMVTSVLDQGLGVFELDSTVRLFVGPVPAVHKFSMLKEGMTVLVQNAHYKTSKQYPRVSLYCCMLTKVHCLDETTPQASPVKLTQTLQKLLYLVGQSQSQLDHMFALRQVLKKQFLDTLGERFTEKIFSTVIGNTVFTAGNMECTDKGSQRLLIDEFLNVPHYCPLERPDTVNVMFTTIAEMKGRIVDVSSDNIDWKFSRQLITQQVVCGILDVSETTGDIVLYDSTGSVDIVTSCYHGDSDKIAKRCHVCTGSCDCNRIEIGRKFACPYVNTCCVGRIVALSVYEMISETMATRAIEKFKGLNGSERSRSSNCDKYLLFDMRNVIYIGNSVDMNKSESKLKGSADNIISDRFEKTHSDTNAQLSCNNGLDTNLKSTKTITDCEYLKTEVTKCNIDSEAPAKTATESKTSNSDVAECVSKQNSSALHKHLKSDGTILFCRKTECCDKQTVIGSRSGFDSCMKSSDEKLISEHESFKENFFVKLEDDPDKVNLLPYKLGKTAFKVKPVSSRKRQCDVSDKRNYSQLHKLPRSESIQQREVEKVDGKDHETRELGGKTEDNETRELEGKPEDNDTRELGGKPDALPDVEQSNFSDNPNDVIMHLDSKGSLMAGDGVRRFNVECTVLKKEENEKLILEFSGKSVKWYPLLHPSSFYKLSLSTENQQVLAVRLANDRLQKMLLKNKSRRCLTVNENLCVTRLWNTGISLQPYKLMPALAMSLQDILKPELTDKFVNFEGWIINRTLVKPGFGPKSLSKDIGSCSMYSRLHVQDGSEDIWVYLNDSSIVSEKAMIPGSRVRFYGLERKMSQLNNIYCRLVPPSSVQIVCVEPDRCVWSQKKDQKLEDSSKEIPLLSLVDLWVPTTAGQVFQCVCDVEKILKVSLKCLCEICGSLFIHTACSNTACKSGGAYRFLARASAVIDDSTSVSMVTVTGSSVQSMLKLSHDQWNCLEEEVSKAGEVFVQQFNPSLNTALERFVYMLCDNNDVKQTWLMTLKTRSSLDINKIGHDEFCMKTFDTGSSRISTQCLPFLQLECVALKVFEPSVWAVHRLSVNK